MQPLGSSAHKQNDAMSFTIVGTLPYDAMN
jgi:hypothetical protein